MDAAVSVSPLSTLISVDNSNHQIATLQENIKEVPNCLQNLPSSAVSASKLESNIQDSDAISSLTLRPIAGESNDGPHGLEVIQNISVKDGCVIGFMLALWLYSLILMFRAWRRILNFSEDQLNRPEAATVLWRWVMDRIRMKRKMNEDNQDVENGGAQSNIDNQAIDDIAQDEGLHYVSSMQNDCGSSKEIEENSTRVVESMLEENMHQRDIMEPSNLSEAYSNGHNYQSNAMPIRTTAMAQRTFNQKGNKSYCVGQATVSLVHMLGQHPMIPSEFHSTSDINEESGTFCNEAMISTHASYTQDSRESNDLEREYDDTVSSNNKSKSDVFIPIAEPQYTDTNHITRTPMTSNIHRSSSGCFSTEPRQYYEEELDTGKSTSNIASHRKSIANFNIKEKSTTCDEVDGDDVEFPVRPKSRSVAYQSGSSPRPPMHRASTSKLRTHSGDTSFIPHVSGHQSQFMDLVMAATTVKPTVPLYKKRRDTFKRTKTTGVISSQGVLARKTGKTTIPAAGQRQDTTTSLTSSHIGQNSFTPNEDSYEKSFEGSIGINVNSSQHSETFTDFSKSSNSTTYQASTEGMENSLIQQSIDELNLPHEPDASEGKNDHEKGKLSTKQKEEIAWIDYHPPPKENNKGNIYKI